MRIYTYLDLMSFVNDSSWTTFFNSRSPKSRVNSRNTFENVNRCCPRVLKMKILQFLKRGWKLNAFLWTILIISLIFYFYKAQYRYLDPVELNSELQKSDRSRVQRISCNMPEKEFIEKYVRTKTPVLLHGCNFNWLQQNKFSLSNAAKVILNHDNHKCF